MRPLDSSRETVERIVEAHTFQRLSRRVRQGEESRQSFFRKGVAGDWENLFTSELKAMYKERTGAF